MRHEISDKSRFVMPPSQPKQNIPSSQSNMNSVTSIPNTCPGGQKSVQPPLPSPYPSYFFSVPPPPPPPAQQQNVTINPSLSTQSTPQQQSHGQHCVPYPYYSPYMANYAYPPTGYVPQ